MAPLFSTNAFAAPGKASGVFCGVTGSDPATAISTLNDGLFQNILEVKTASNGPKRIQIETVSAPTVVELSQGFMTCVTVTGELQE